MRWYDVPAPLGRISFWGNLTRASRASSTDGREVGPDVGWALAFKHLRPKLLGGYNNLIISYGRGVMENLRTDPPAPTVGQRDAERLLVTEHFLLQPSVHFAVMSAFVYQRRTTGEEADGVDSWVSLGTRPVAYFTRHLSLALEAGADWTDSGVGAYRGWLRKVTLAPQLIANHEFFSRPVLRLFLTYADWSEGLEGHVGGEAHRRRTRGLSFGVHGETWW